MLSSELQGLVFAAITLALIAGCLETIMAGLSKPIDDVLLGLTTVFSATGVIAAYSCPLLAPGARLSVAMMAGVAIAAAWFAHRNVRGLYAIRRLLRKLDREDRREREKSKVV